MIPPANAVVKASTITPSQSRWLPIAAVAPFDPEQKRPRQIDGEQQCPGAVPHSLFPAPSMEMMRARKGNADSIKIAGRPGDFDAALRLPIHSLFTIKRTQQMETGTRSTLADVFRQRCPRCRQGSMFRSSIYRGFPRMCERCCVCDLKFQREEGYFLGAMYISFGLAIVIIALLTALLWVITGWWITKDTIWAVVLFLPCAPSISLFARVLWIYLDQTFDPEKP